MRKISIGVAVLAVLAGCASGRVDYAGPTTSVAPASNVKIVNRARDDVWAASVPELGKQFFVINNMDRASGFINVSYNGDPEKYVDCGRITSRLMGVNERVYDFPGAKAQQTYEVVITGVDYVQIERKMSLEGRVNLVFEELPGGQTRVTANTRYVVQRSQVARSARSPIPASRTDTVSFNSGGNGAFPPAPDGRAAECAATGVLEREILSAIR